MSEHKHTHTKSSFTNTHDAPKTSKLTSEEAGGCDLDEERQVGCLVKPMTWVGSSTVNRNARLFE